MIRNKSIRFITFTAMGLALITLFQWLSNIMPAGAVIFGPFSLKQLITGSLVNCVLIVFAGCVGLTNAVTVGILSALLASVIGVGPQILPVVPLIALGNVIIVLVYWLCAEKGNLPIILSVVISSICKCGFMWLTIPWVLSMLTKVPEKQVSTLSVMFSWPQGITALIGGIIALMIIPKLKKSIKKN